MKLFSFEHKNAHILSRKKFYSRVFYNLTWAGVVLVLSLAIGVTGYMTLAGLPLADAVQNASMILGGMGPIDPMPNNAAKYFASVYALFSGITFISTIAIIVAPVVHRAMHFFHLESEEEEGK